MIRKIHPAEKIHSGEDKKIPCIAHALYRGVQYSRTPKFQALKSKGLLATDEHPLAASAPEAVRRATAAAEPLIAVDAPHAEHDEAAARASD